MKHPRQSPARPINMNDLSAPPRPLQLPRYSRNEAQARATIAQHGQALALRLGDVPWQAALTPLAHAPESAADPWTLTIEWAGATLCAHVPAAAIGEFTAPLLDGAALADLPTELAHAVLEAALGDIFTALRLLGRGEPRLLELQPRGKTAAACVHALGLLLRQGDGPAAVLATLHVDAMGLLLLAGLLASRPSAPPRHAEDWPLTLPAEIGFTALASDELASLAPGDVVLLAVSHVAAERVLWLTQDGRHGLQVQLPPIFPPESPRMSTEPESPGASEATDATEALPSAPALVVIQAWNTAMSTATEIPAAEAIASLDALPVRLSFDLGEVTLTLAQARALQPGQTLELARPLTAGVRIRANGALIGEGDLVEIDGQLGISIRSLTGHAA